MTVALARLARAVARGWVVILTCVAVGALAGFAVASSASPVYRAEAALVVQAEDTPDPRGTRLAVNILAESEEVRREAARLFGEAAGRLGDRLFFSIIPGEPAVVLRAEGGSPEESERLVAAYRDALLRASRALPRRADGAPLLIAASAPAADERRVRPRALPAAAGAGLLALVIGIALVVWRRPG